MGAMLQRIVYNEFLPMVLGHYYMRKFRLDLQDSGKTSHYNPNMDTSIM